MDISMDTELGNKPEEVVRIVDPHDRERFSELETISRGMEFAFLVQMAKHHANKGEVKKLKLVSEYIAINYPNAQNLDIQIPKHIQSTSLSTNIIIDQRYLKDVTDKNCARSCTLLQMYLIKQGDFQTLEIDSFNVSGYEVGFTELKYFILHHILIIKPKDKDIYFAASPANFDPDLIYQSSHGALARISGLRQGSSMTAFKFNRLTDLHVSDNLGKLMQHINELEGEGSVKWKPSDSKYNDQKLESEFIKFSR